MTSITLSKDTNFVNSAINFCVQDNSVSVTHACNGHCDSTLKLSLSDARNLYRLKLSVGYTIEELDENEE